MTPTQPLSRKMLYWVRFCLVIAFPFVVAWAYFGTLFREFRSAFWFAQNAVRQELASLPRLWRGET